MPLLIHGSWILIKLRNKEVTQKAYNTRDVEIQNLEVMINWNVFLLLVLLQDEWQQPWMESWEEQEWVCVAFEVKYIKFFLTTNLITPRKKESRAKQMQIRQKVRSRVQQWSNNHKTYWTYQTIVTTTTINSNAFYLSDWVVMLSWGWQPVSSSPFGQWGIPSQRCPASMQPPGGGQENWPVGQLRGLVAVGEGCVPACRQWLY